MRSLLVDSLGREGDPAGRRKQRNPKQTVRRVLTRFPCSCVLEGYATYNVNHYRHEDGACDGAAILGILLATDEFRVVLLEENAEDAEDNNRENGDDGARDVDELLDS